MRSLAKPLKPSLKDRLAADQLFKTSADLPRLVELDLVKLRPDPEQPRKSFDGEALQELAASIEKTGLLQPILVRPDPTLPEHWIVVAGERRFRAFGQLGRSTIPAIVTDGDPLEVALVENLQRERLDPFEEGSAVQRLMEERGWTQDEVGRAVGKKQNTISALLSLARLPPRIQAEYRAEPGRVGRSLLVEIAQAADATEQLRLWDLARSGTTTVKAVRAARKPAAASQDPRPLPRARLLARAHEVQFTLGHLSRRDLDRDTRHGLEQLWKALGRLLEKGR